MGVQTVALFRKRTIKQVDDVIHRGLARRVRPERILIYVVRTLEPSFLEISYVNDPLDVDRRGIPDARSQRHMRTTLGYLNKRNTYRQQITSKLIAVGKNKLGKALFGSVLCFALGRTALMKKDRLAAMKRGIDRSDRRLDDLVSNRVQRQRELDQLVRNIHGEIY